MAYDEETTAYTDLPVEYTTPLFGDDYCHACTEKAKRERMSKPRITSHGIELWGVTYHKDDFVYLVPPGNSNLLGIAQIEEIMEQPGGKASIQVQYLRRHVETQPPFSQETISNQPPKEIFFDEVRR